MIEQVRLWRCGGSLALSAAQPGVEDHSRHAEQALPTGQQAVEREGSRPFGFLALGFFHQWATVFLVRGQQGPGQAGQCDQVLPCGEAPRLYAFQGKPLLAEAIAFLAGSAVEIAVDQAFSFS